MNYISVLFFFESTKKNIIDQTILLYGRIGVIIFFRVNDFYRTMKLNHEVRLKSEH